MIRLNLTIDSIQKKSYTIWISNINKLNIIKKRYKLQKTYKI